MQKSGTLSVVPATYEELYREYADYVKTLVRKFGIDQENVEDVTSILMIKILEKNLLSQFNGEMVSTNTGKPVQFKSYLYGFVATYVQHHRSRQQLIKRRDCYYIGTTDDETSWLASEGHIISDLHEDLETEELLDHIREILTTPAIPASRSAIDMDAFYTMLVEQVDEHGRVYKSQLSDHFGVSPNTIGKMLRRLREELAVRLAVL